MTPAEPDNPSTKMVIQGNVQGTQECPTAISNQHVNEMNAPI